MIPISERDASVVRKRAKSGAIIAALGAICGLGDYGFIVFIGIEDRLPLRGRCAGISR